ncbi:MAG: ABC transporter ATP-binding protein [Desulfobacterales bacterium]|nr:ABC transporter ATP-binding protein [Desulfobacterales bacterium]
MSHHIIEVNDLHYTYPDGTSALSGISFRITHGESVAIVGANAAGKSTLLLHLNGFITPNIGKIRIGDFSLTKKTLPMIRRTLGMVFQDPDDQLFMPTIYDDVAFGPINLGLSKEDVHNKVLDALSSVGILHLKDRPPYRLSGGERRAAAIATVIAMSPDILVMDEPTSNLDPKSRRNLIELLKTFKHTKIIATHDLDMAVDLCERVIVMHNGKIVADGSIMEIFQNDSILFSSHLEKPLRMQGCPKCQNSFIEK